MDKFSKYVEIIPTNMTAGTAEIYNLLLHHIFRRYGYPKSIISDRDPRFNSKLAKELAELLNINMRYSTAYHPETDGQTERMNQEVEIYLRHYVSFQQTDWKDRLIQTQIALNNRKSSATGKGAYEALLG